MDTILRDYQSNLCEFLTQTFLLKAGSSEDYDSKTSIDELRYSLPNHLEEDHYPAIMVVAPTGSGKTEIQRQLTQNLKCYGINSLVVVHLETVRLQLENRGLTARTIQGVMSASRAFSGLPEDERLEKILTYLDLPKSFLAKNISIIIDEAHYGFETNSSMYSEILPMLGVCPLYIGFTATPAPVEKRMFPYVFADRSTKDYLADSFCSNITCASYLTISSQIGLFPAPRIIFGRDIISVFLIYLGLELDGLGHNAICTANTKKQIFDYFENTIKQIEKIGDWSNLKKIDMDLFTRIARICLAGLALDLLLTKSNKSQTQVKERLTEFKELCLTNDPFSIIKRFRLLVDVSDSTELNNETLGELVFNVYTKTKELPPKILRSKKSIQSDSNVLSVFKVSTGFDVPEIRTVIMADTVVESQTLYIQRAGRGSRKTETKDAFHLVELSYISKISQRKLIEGSGVFWKDLALTTPQATSSRFKSELICRADINRHGPA